MADNGSYKKVIDLFTNKISEDKEFFCYYGLTDDEALEIINRRIKELLQLALNELQIKKAKKQDVNFLDVDFDNEEFGFELIDTEIDLISDLMEVKLFDKQMLKVKAVQKYLGDDIKIFSPNEERKTILELIDYKHSLFNRKLSDYNMIDRNTGDFLLAY